MTFGAGYNPRWRFSQRHRAGWRLIDLAQWAHEELGVAVSRQTLGRELRAMGFTKLSARPQHYTQDEEAIAVFKKTSAPAMPTSAPNAAGGLEAGGFDPLGGK